MMSGQGLKIRATVRMQKAEQLLTVRPLESGWGPVIWFRGKPFPGRVLACEKPIEPGLVGEIVLGLMARHLEDVGVRANAEFELRDGLSNLIATGTVIDYSEV